MKTIFLLAALLPTFFATSDPELDSIKGVFNPVRLHKYEAVLSGENLSVRYLQDNLYEARITVNGKAYRVKRIGNLHTLSYDGDLNILAVRKGKEIRLDGNTYYLRGRKLLSEREDLLAKMNFTLVGIGDRMELQINEYKNIPEELWPFLMTEGVRRSWAGAGANITW